MTVTMKPSTHNSEMLARLVTAYVDLVYAAALRQVRDPHLADDVTQAVFLVVMRKGDRLPEEALLPGWLLKATRYTALMALRADRRRKRNERAAGLKCGKGEAREREVRVEAVLDEALMALTETDRQLVVQRYMQGRTVWEIAATLSLKENTAAKRLERAVGRMRAYFEKRGVKLTEAAMGAAIPVVAMKAAPVGLAGAIVQAGASGAAASVPLVGTSVPIGVWLMTMPAAAKVAAGVVVVTLAVGGTYATVKAVVAEREVVVAREEVASAEVGGAAIKVSKETTEITEPLGAAGLPDYVAAMNAKYGKGVTPENNGFVMWWGVMPDAPSMERKLGPKAQARLEGLMGVQGVDRTGIKFQDYRDRWDKNDGGPWEKLRQAQAKVWVEKDDPALAAYLRDMEPAMEVLEAAAAKEHWWCPAVTDDDGQAILANSYYNSVLPAIDAIIARASLRFGTGDFAGFVTDYVTARRLAAHMAAGPMGLSRLRGREEAWRANRMAGAAVASGKLTLAQCEALAKAMDAIPKLGTSTEPADVADRWSVLAAICAIARTAQGGDIPKVSLWADGREGLLTEEVRKKLGTIDREAVDWNYVLTRINAQIDAAIASSQQVKFSDLQSARAKDLKDFQRFEKALTGNADLHRRPQENDAEYSERILQALNSQVPAGAIFWEFFARPVDMHEPMLRALLAAAMFKAKTGDWPDTVEQLVPEYLPAVGKDIYSPQGDEPLKYVVSKNGPRVYSVGPDGKDDFGQLVREKKMDDPHVGAEEGELK